MDEKFNCDIQETSPSVENQANEELNRRIVSAVRVENNRAASRREIEEAIARLNDFENEADESKKSAWNRNIKARQIRDELNS